MEGNEWKGITEKKAEKTIEKYMFLLFLFGSIKEERNGIVNNKYNAINKEM